MSPVGSAISEGAVGLYVGRFGGGGAFDAGTADQTTAGAWSCRMVYLDRQKREEIARGEQSRSTQRD